MIELEHPFSTDNPVDETWKAILDLERLVPCVEGGTVIEKTSAASVKAQIKVKMGAMSLTYSGTVEVAEQDAATHRVLLRVKSRETGGQGFANADVEFSLANGGGTVRTSAKITGKAASMGEDLTATVLDGLIRNFTQTLAAL